MRKSCKVRGGVVFLLVVFVLSMGSVSWAGLNCDCSRPQIKEKQVQGQQKWIRDQQKKKFNLNLTSEQKVKLARLRLSFQEQTVDLRGKLAKKKIKFQKLWLKKPLDKDKIYSLIDETAKIKAQINKKAVNFILRAKEILTPGQLKKLPFPGIKPGWKKKHFSRLH